jgi:predicted permease
MNWLLRRLSGVWQWAGAEDLLLDVRYGLRTLRRSPGFTALAALMLALGLGVNAMVFCWVETIVLNPLPGISVPARLAAVVEADSRNVLVSRVSYPDFKDLTGLNRVFAGIAGTSPAEVTLDINGQTSWVEGRVASANTFDVLGVKPERGRTFLPEEDHGEGSHPVLVISHGLWQRQFGGDTDIVGRTVLVNRHLFTIIGVTPPNFRGVTGGSQVDLWAPLSMHDAVLNYGSYSSRAFRWIQMLARLRPGTSVPQAQAAAATLSRQLERAYPDTNKGVEFRVFPLSKSPFGGQVTFLPALRILFAVSLGILLIVTTNVACLLLARAAYREKEVAIRLAIGGGRSRVIRQFLTESLLLSFGGGCLGALWARPAVRLLPLFIPRSSTSFVYDFQLDERTLTFTLFLTLGTAVTFGLLPAWRAAHANLLPVLKDGGRASSEGPRYHRLLDVLIVTEVALALLLLVGAGLCAKGLAQARRLNLGFDPNHVLYASLDLVPNGYSPEKAKAFDQELRRRLASLPGVTDVAFVNTPPLSANGMFTGSFDVEGHAATSGESNLVPFVIVSPGYFSTLRIPVVEGRRFTDQDDSTRENVAIINETMSQRYWPGLDPVGRRFRMAVGVASSATFTVVGVVGNGKYESLAEPPTPVVYVNYLQRPLASLFMNLLVRTRGDPERYVQALRNEIHALDPSVEPLGVVTLREYVQTAFLPARVATTFLAILGVTSLVLASLGIYGVIAFAVGQRRHEIGIRVALGAERRDILKLIVGRGFRLATFGVAIGVLGALGLTRFLSSLLFGVKALDPLTFLAASLILIAFAIVASYIPARRALRVDTVMALRNE